MHNANIIEMETVGYPEMTNVDMTGTLSSGGAAITLQLDGTFVILGELTV